jgi:hypothetical protein
MKTPKKRLLCLAIIMVIRLSLGCCSTRFCCKLTHMTFDEMDCYMAAGFMTNMFSFVDEQIAILNELITKDINDSGDSSLFDDAEYLKGIGFVAGQRYITSTHGSLKVRKEEKWESLLLGPKRPNGITYASVVNAVANYWKHSDEWDFSKLDGQQERTRKEIESVGIIVSEGYVICNVFQQLELKTFSDLTPMLKEWSNAVMDWKIRATLN